MRKRTSSIEPAAMTDEDLSLLRRPMHTSFTGFQEAKLAFENGTDEVRRLLVHECSLIYECNVCRNMFRSLANFISHKRVFCCETADENSNGFRDDNSVVIIQAPESDIIKRSRSTGASPVPRIRASNASNRDISSVIERLKREHKAEKLLENHTPVLQLERVPNSSQAMYQTLKRKESDSIKTEVNEVHQMLANMEIVLGPDGKVVTTNSYSNDCDQGGGSNEADKEQQMTGQIVCEICNLRFQTEKTLKIHIQKKHISSTYVFQCPNCSLTFLQPQAVIRHLTNEHKKPVRRIRMMRDTIMKRRIQLGDVQVKGPSRELKRLQLLEPSTSTEAAEIVVEQTKPVSTCTYCQRTFERRAAFATHFISCRSKHEALEKPPPLKRRKLQPYEFTPAVDESTETRNSLLNMNDTIKEEPIDPDALNELFVNLANQSFGSGLETVTLDKLEALDGESAQAGNAEEIKSNANVSDQQASTKHAPEKKGKRRFRIVHAAKNLSCRCKICNKHFNALSNLRRHISMFHYRARKFGCKLCDYRAFRRYDIVNHLGFVHKMTGERETMSTEFVAVHEVHYSKDDVDGDIVLLTDETEANALTETVLKTYAKRTKRLNKTKSLISAVNPTSMTDEDGSLNPARQKLKRSQQQQQKNLQKRPIRNRIKTIKKDFVYDLNNSETTVGSDPATLLNNVQFGDTLLMNASLYNGTDHHSQPLVHKKKEQIKGSAQRISLLLVNQGRAASSTLPELPSERPQMRPRLTSTYRNDMQTVPVIETWELEAARLKATFLDDSFLEKISKCSGVGFRMKPCVTLQHSALDSLLQKVDSSLHCNNPAIKTPPLMDESFLDKEISEAELIDEPPAATPIDTISYHSSDASDVSILARSPQSEHFTDTESSIPESSSPPPTPRKRVTLMQRLADNKAKHHDSLLRTALEN